MNHIAFLIADSDTLQDGNYLRLANECFRRGHEVWLCGMESIGLAGSRAIAHGVRLAAAVAVGEPLPVSKAVHLEHFDTIWVLSLGMRHSFLDKMQLLYTLRSRCRIVNSIDTIMHFKSKYFTASNAHIYQHPFTSASTNPDELFKVMQREGGNWIVKPPASSFGRDVYRLTATDPNVHVILESMCGPDRDRYCLLQRYVDEIGQGEKRVLLAGGKPVGQYLRLAAKDHRTNTHQGASIQSCELTDVEYQYCEKIGHFLLTYGAEFVGVDLTYPWVIEFNVINPGGLLTIEQVAHIDVTADIVDNVIDAYPRRLDRSPGFS